MNVKEITMVVGVAVTAIIAATTVAAGSIQAFAAGTTNTKDVLVSVIDDDTGNRVAGATVIAATPDRTAFTTTTTNTGGKADFSVAGSTETVDICVDSIVGSNCKFGVTLRPQGTTTVTIYV